MTNLLTNRSVDNQTSLSRIGTLSRLLVLLLIAAALLSGCGGSGGGGGGGGSTQIVVQISPTTATMVVGGTQTFTASATGTTNPAIIWSCSAGTIDQAGHYVAPATAGQYSVVARSAADTTASATAVVTVSASTGIVVSVTPAVTTVGFGTQVQLTATVTGTSNTAVTWTATGGTIDQSGLFTAPNAAGSFSIIATSAANTKISGRAIVVVTSSAVNVSPSTFTCGWTETQQFTATVIGISNQAVTWSATGGTISTGGLFTAGTTSGKFTVTATSVAQPALVGTATVTVTPITLTVKPNPGTVVTGQPIQMTGTVVGANNKKVTWTTSAGTITSAGILTAPTTASTVTVTGTSAADPAISNTATVNVINPSHFFYDFVSGVPGVWNPTTNEKTPSGIPFLGRLSGTNGATLVLDTLTTHSTVTVTFDLYVIGAWGGITPANTMIVSVGGTTGFSQSFSNQLNLMQSYPDGTSNAPGTSSTGLNTLGYTSDPSILYSDSTYHITCTVPHTSSSITIKFTGNLTGTVSQMAWGLKNVDILANP